MRLSPLALVGVFLAIASTFICFDLAFELGKQTVSVLYKVHFGCTWCCCIFDQYSVPLVL